MVIWQDGSKNINLIKHDKQNTESSTCDLWLPRLFTLNPGIEPFILKKKHGSYVLFRFCSFKYLKPDVIPQNLSIWAEDSGYIQITSNLRGF